MAKYCDFCGEKVGYFSKQVPFKDGMMGKKCLTKYGMGNAASMRYAKKHTVQEFKDLIASGKTFKDIQSEYLTDAEKRRAANVAKHDKLMEKYNKMLPIFQKETTAKFSHYIFDDKRQQILQKKAFLSDPRFINYSDIISYKVNQSGHDEEKHHGIMRALVGGALAGGVGAIVGATTGGKQYDYIDHLGLIVTLKDGSDFEIVFIRKIEQEKANSSLARDDIQELNALISMIDAIIAKNNQTAKTTSTENTNPDSASEIRKFKKLADDGIITQDEFEAKKKQLLGL